MPTPLNLTAIASGANATSYATASITPAVAKQTLASVHTRGASDSLDPPLPTLSGCGLVWTVFASNVYDKAGTVHERLDIFIASPGIPSTGVVTVNYGAYTAQACAIVVDQVDNTSGFLQSTVIGGSTSTSPTTGSVTLSSLSRAGNAVYAVLGLQANDRAIPSLTELGHAESSEPLSIQSVWGDGSSLTPSFTWSAGASWGAIAIEMVAVAYSSASVNIQTKKLPKIEAWDLTELHRSVILGTPNKVFRVTRNLETDLVPSSRQEIISPRRYYVHDFPSVTPSPTTGQIWPRRKRGN